MRSLLVVLILATSAAAAEPKVLRDQAYADSKDPRQRLDVYAPAEGQKHPIVVWIHGGGWRQGDKAGVQRKPHAFTERGFVIASINYRLAPDATLKEMTGDVAQAVRWIHDHAADFGGDPDAIFVMGHSAGAHLAALVCTDGRYLETAGLSLASIKGCMPVDTGVYDAAKQIESVLPQRRATYRGVFSESPATQKEFSPMTYVAKDRQIPPFLILHVADRPDSKAQSEMFAAALRAAGVPAKVFAGEGKTHGTINSELGDQNDPPTKAMWEFLDGLLQQSPAAKS
ncbi:MAG TPA: alpha/beta hydrolase [Pirellulales bacterium]|jgi:acetyl esterase/lipase|nr:alpha/beta hydrolase [Pirellulales bacterium]